MRGDETAAFAALIAEHHHDGFSMPPYGLFSITPAYEARLPTRFHHFIGL